MPKSTAETVAHSADVPMTRVDTFLLGLKSTGKLDYKRYLGSPLRYAGGKSLGVCPRKAI